MGSIALDDITNVMHGNDEKILSVDHYTLVIWQALDNNSPTEFYMLPYLPSRSYMGL